MKTILKNFIHTLLHYKVSSILNVLGLALAFASMYILLVQVHWELTYNHSIKDADRVFIMEQKGGFSEGQFTMMLPRPIPENVIAQFLNIESFGTNGYGGYAKAAAIKKEDKIVKQDLTYCDVSLGFLNVFGFESVEGSLHNLVKPNTVAVPQSFASTYGLSVGDVIYTGDYEVKEENVREIVAVYKDFANNTMLRSSPILCDMGEEYMTDYREWSFFYFVKLKSIEDKAKFEVFWAKYIKEYFKENGLSEGELKEVQVRLVPLTEMYFENDTENWGFDRGNEGTVYTLLAIAVLIVVIALINFVNFFYALIPVRIKKVNTLKIFGSPIYALRLNFIVEALGLVFIALFIAWYLIYMVQSSSLAEYVNTSLSLSDNPFILSVTLIVAFVVAILSSVYPAYYITSMPMAFVIKGAFSASKSGKIIRTALLGVQFVISISLIIASVFMIVQHSYMMNYDMGFNKENLISLYPMRVISENSNKAFTDKLLSNSQIKAVTWSQGILVNNNRMGWGLQYKDERIKFQCFPVSSNFLEVMGIDMVDGRGFTADDDFKSEGKFIFNEYAQKQFGLIVDDKIEAGYGPTQLVGICEDFNFQPLRYKTTPFALYVYGSEVPKPLDHVYLRTTANADMKAVMDYIRLTVMEFDLSISKDDVIVKFFDEELGWFYAKEERLTTLITLFSVVSIVISLMGVFGLVLFETQYRRKEIGIRRVHGASRREILAMFNRKYIVMVLVCFVVAVPISYYILDKWVSGFAYRASLSWWIFALALLLVLLITIITVTIRSMKAANDDPANSIKTE